MFEHLYLPKRRQARSPRPPWRAALASTDLVRLTKKGAALLEDHLKRRGR